MVRSIGEGEEETEGFKREGTVFNPSVGAFVSAV
jgi:hypothetical protein